MASYLKVCRKASQSKRDVFDAQAQRLHGTEAAEVILRQPTREHFNAKELVRSTNSNVGNLGKELITTLADWKSMDYRREMERAERDRGALRQCFCCFFCCCCWASSDSKKPEVEGGATGKGSNKSWWPPSLSQLALMAQVAKMASKVFKKNKKEEGPKIEEIFS